MSIFDNIGTILDYAGPAISLVTTLPAAIKLLETELPTVEGDIKAGYEAVLTPAKAVLADAKVTFQGGAATVISANVEKTVADMGAVVTAIENLIPQLEAEAEAEYAKILPVLSPLAADLGVKLPAVAQQVTAAPAAA